MREVTGSSPVVSTKQKGKVQTFPFCLVVTEHTTGLEGGALQFCSTALWAVSCNATAEPVARRGAAGTTAAQGESGSERFAGEYIELQLSLPQTEQHSVLFTGARRQRRKSCHSRQSGGRGCCLSRRFGIFSYYFCPNAFRL